MLTAFDVGAEDYVVKPFSMKVLLKRIEVVLRRGRPEEEQRGQHPCLPGSGTVSGEKAGTPRRK